MWLLYQPWVQIPFSFLLLGTLLGLWTRAWQLIASKPIINHRSKVLWLPFSICFSLFTDFRQVDHQLSCAAPRVPACVLTVTLPQRLARLQRLSIGDWRWGRCWWGCFTSNPGPKPKEHLFRHRQIVTYKDLTSRCEQSFWQSLDMQPGPPPSFHWHTRRCSTIGPLNGS